MEPAGDKSAVTFRYAIHAEPGQSSGGGPVKVTLKLVERTGLGNVVVEHKVTSQINDFVDSVGGVGHLLLMGQAGHLSHADAMDQITLVAREVLPRVQRPAATSKQAA